ncbi:MAG: glutathione transferase GstA [Pseudomonadota bacterium]
MKLFYSPGACSMAAHIALREAGLPFQLERVDLKTKKMADGGDFRSLNPNGYVPVLLLDDGQVLTEGAVILQYVADRVPDKKLAPPAGTLERYRLQEWLNFIATEVHKVVGSLYNPAMPMEWQEQVRSLAGRRLAYVAQELEGRDYLMDGFTVADAYLYTILNWTRLVKVDLSDKPGLLAYMKRVGARPAVQETLAAEGLK